MKIFIGADHRGYELKQKITAFLAKRDYDVTDLGNTVYDKDDDFTEYAAKVAVAVIGSDDDDPRGILICGGGQGMAIAVNRFNGIRAVVITNDEDAKISRHENDANVLCLSAEVFNNSDIWPAVIEAWLETKFSAKSRYIRRNKLLDELS